MNAENILTKSDCEVARTPKELIAWVESVAPRFEVEDKRLIKAFYEEIRPLGHLARHKYFGRRDFYLCPKIGDQNYDAEMIDASADEEHIQRVEFTSAYRDYDLALRLEYLAEHGDVYMTGSVWRDSNGQVRVHADFMDHQIILDGLVATCEEQVENKLAGDYAPGTLLAIFFDDTILYPTDMPLITQYFRDTLSKLALSKFCGLFILGASGRTFWEFGETDLA